MTSTTETIRKYLDNDIRGRVMDLLFSVTIDDPKLWAFYNKELYDAYDNCDKETFKIYVRYILYKIKVQKQRDEENLKMIESLLCESNLIHTIKKFL